MHHICHDRYKNVDSGPALWLQRRQLQVALQGISYWMSAQSTPPGNNGTAPRYFTINDMNRCSIMDKTACMCFDYERCTACVRFASEA